MLKKLSLSFLFIIFLFNLGYSEIPSIILEKIPFESNLIKNVAFLYVDPDAQRMYYLSENNYKEYIISISKKKMNIEEGSLGTPWGLHEIDGKFGEGQPLGMVFQSRKPIEKFYWDCKKDEFCGITTRILRLRGIEEGINSGNCVHRKNHSCDTYDRYIYIHGTRDEENLGKPKSDGCIHVSNVDAIELFDLIPERTYVYIDGSMHEMCILNDIDE